MLAALRAISLLDRLTGGGTQFSTTSQAGSSRHVAPWNTSQKNIARPMKKPGLDELGIFPEIRDQLTSEVLTWNPHNPSNLFSRNSGKVKIGVNSIVDGRVLGLEKGEEAGVNSCGKTKSFNWSIIPEILDLSPAQKVAWNASSSPKIETLVSKKRAVMMKSQESTFRSPWS